MASWVEESFSLVARGGYLDALASIYPAPPLACRPLVERDLILVKAALAQPDDSKLLADILTLERFPFNDPYVSFLRKNPTEIQTNPNTAGRICGRLREMGLDGVVRSLEEPPQFNRQMGPMFNKWLRSQYPSTKDLAGFQGSTEPLVVLDMAGAVLRQFANRIGCGLDKEPDFVAKVKGRYVIGEAKFIGTEGGNQNRAFEDAINLAGRSFRNAVTAAVLDGIVWIPNSGQMSRRLDNFSGNALTALLLDRFFHSL